MIEKEEEEGSSIVLMQAEHQKSDQNKILCTSSLQKWGFILLYVAFNISNLLTFHQIVNGQHVVNLLIPLSQSFSEQNLTIFTLTSLIFFNHFLNYALNINYALSALMGFIIAVFTSVIIDQRQYFDEDFKGLWSRGFLQIFIVSTFIVYFSERSERQIHLQLE